MPKFLQRLSLFLLLIVPTGLTAQETPSYEDEAWQLLSEAQDLVAPVALQAQGYRDMGLTPAQAEQRLRKASLLVEAAQSLAPRLAPVWQTSAHLYMTSTLDDPGRAYNAVRSFNRITPSDADLVDHWLTFQYEHYQTREDRMAFIDAELLTFRTHPWLLSRLLTRKGYLLEQSGMMDDNEAQKQLGAISFYEQAFDQYPYQPDLLVHLIDVSESPEHIARIPLLETLYWRIRLHAQPYDQEALLHLIETLDHYGLYALAQPFYDHAYRLLEYFGADEALILEIRRNHLFNLYSAGQYQDVVDMSDAILKSHPDDLPTLALLSKAHGHLDQTTAKKRAMDQADRAAEQLWMRHEDSSFSPDDKLVLEWYYCFADPNAQRVLTLSDGDPNEIDGHDRLRGLRAYAFWLNGQADEAESLLETASQGLPLLQLTRAHLLLDKKKTDPAREALTAIQLVPKALVAEAVRALYAELPPPITFGQPETADTATPADADPALAASIQAGLARYFTNADLEIPFAPEKGIDCSIRFLRKTDVFYYNDPILARLYLTNIGKASIELGPGNLVNPIVFVYATVEALPPGLLNTAKPQATFNAEKASLLTYVTLGQQPLLQRRGANEVTLSLNLGPVRRLLQDYPQTTFRVTYKLLLDPIPDGKGGYLGNLPALQPRPVAIVRKAFNPTEANLKKLYRDIRFGSPEERLTTIRLADGLLREAALAESGQARYPVRPVPQAALRSWLAENLDATEFRVRAETVKSLGSVSGTSDTATLSRLTENLTHPNELVSFRAADALDAKVDLTAFYDWAVDQELTPLVRRYAQMKLNRPWTVEPFSYESAGTGETNQGNSEVGSEQTSPPPAAVR